MRVATLIYIRTILADHVKIEKGERYGVFAGVLAESKRPLGDNARA